MWIVFKDSRGVLYCEPQDPGVIVYTKTIPAVTEKRDWLSGKTIRHARPAQTLHQIKLDSTQLSMDDYTKAAFEPSEGYACDPSRAVVGRWGMVEVLLRLKDPDLGYMFQYHLRRLAPEGDIYDLSWKTHTRRGMSSSTCEPDPHTQWILDEMLALFSPYQKL